MTGDSLVVVRSQTLGAFRVLEAFALSLNREEALMAGFYVELLRA